MKKLPKTKAKLYEVTLTEQLPHKDYYFRYYMDGDELFSPTSTLRFQAVDVQHAIQLIDKTQYSGNIRKVT